MLETLLRTKLFIPPSRPDLVPRRHLLGRLEQGLTRKRKLTLIAAPAGSGKSTLLGEWIAVCDRPVAWVTLDGGDGDSRRFLTYFAAALQTLPSPDAEKPGENTVAMLQAPQPLPLETILISLINEVAAIPNPFLLVLDDYHTLDAAPVDNALTFLLDNQPPQMHLVISSREDPNLPLARLRARGQLTELRAADLRFSREETALFLNQLMHLDLSPAEIDALEMRTEGWAAGLRMAALALQKIPVAQSDRRAFIDTFTGSHRFVLDYLLEEVLQRHSAAVRRFLLCTSILEQLSGPLCDAVMGEEDTGNGRHILSTLESSNLFLIPLDDQRQWYRYHHLFAEVLQAYLRDESDIDHSELHRRASKWFEAHNVPAAAIRHSLAAEDFSSAARLIEAAWPAMDRSFQSAAWLAWADQLPQELVRTRPYLCVQYAWALIDNGAAAGAAARLQDAEQWLAQQEDDTIDEALQAMILIVHAQVALVRGKVDAAEQLARQAQPFAAGDPLRRAQADVLQGIANWNRGNLEAAYDAMTDWANSMMQAGNHYFAVSSTFVLADLREAQGRLHDAVRIYRQSLAQVAQDERPLRRVLCHHFLGLALLYHEMGRTEESEEAWARASEVGKHSVLIDWPYRWQRARARRKISTGEWEAALEMLDEAERQYVPNAVPDTEPLDALRARIYLRQGRLSPARAWARAHGLTADDPPHFLQEYAHLTLVRVLLAGYIQEGVETDLTAARRLLARLLPAAEAGGRLGRVIEIRMLQAVAAHAAGNISAALQIFTQTVKLAQPAGFFRIFVDEGEALTSLVQAAAAEEVLPDYTGRLLTAMKNSAVSSKPQPLADPLSPRELEVLRLLQTELSGPQIAQELVVALSTIRSHTKQIYSKLDVSSRRAAVKRAAALGLL